jgi:hypothetical protein
MDQLDSHFYKRAALNKRPGATLCPLSTTERSEINNCTNRNLHFAFQFDRNMAREFHTETVVAAANFQ